MTLSPLVVTRLLLVLDYLVYQFSGPPPQLTEQVRPLTVGLQQYTNMDMYMYMHVHCRHPYVIIVPL